MKVAITGKGGVGKTTLAAALARLFARSGHDVVAVDADPNPNLGIALGIDVQEAERFDSVINFLLDQAVPHSHGHGSEAPPEMDAEELLDRLGVLGPDGVKLIQTGRIQRPSAGCLCCGSHRATRRMFDELSGEGRVIVADLEAGVTDLCWTDPKPVDTVVVVTTADRSSLEVARRALQVTRDLDVGPVIIVANRIEVATQAEAIRSSLAGSDVIEIPEDPMVRRAEQRGRSPLDLPEHCRAVEAMKAVAAHLLASESPSEQSRR